MKRSELKQYIKEEILSTLNEATKEDVETTKELTAAVKDLGNAKKEAGLNEVGDDKRFYGGYDKMTGSIITSMMEMKKYVEVNEPEALPLLDKALSAYEDFDGYMAYGSQNELNEEDEKEPSKAELKKTKGLAKAKDELVLLTREMKSLARKYKKAEGVEKDKLVDELKKKTKLKKELEAIVNKA